MARGYIDALISFIERIGENSLFADYVLTPFSYEVHECETELSRYCTSMSICSLRPPPEYRDKTDILVMDDLFGGNEPYILRCCDTSKVGDLIKKCDKIIISSERRRIDWQLLNSIGSDIKKCVIIITNEDWQYVWQDFIRYGLEISSNDVAIYYYMD